MQTLKPRVQTLIASTARSQTQVTRIRGNSLYAIRDRIFDARPICAICDTYKATELDHIIPLWAGGQESDANRQGLCHECHQAKTDQEAKQRASLGLAPLAEYKRQ
jgi:5-methylcytosine-specific restriction protein A